MNLTTGATYPFARVASFDPASYGYGSPYSGIVQYQDQAFNNPGLVFGPRVGFGLDVLGNGKLALRGGFGIFYDRAFGVDTDGATSAGVGPISAPPKFQAPIYYNTTFTTAQQRARLPDSGHRLHRAAIIRAPPLIAGASASNAISAKA